MTGLVLMFVGTVFFALSVWYSAGETAWLTYIADPDYATFYSDPVEEVLLMVGALFFIGGVYHYIARAVAESRKPITAGCAK